MSHVHSDTLGDSVYSACECGAVKRKKDAEWHACEKCAPTRTNPYPALLAAGATMDSHESDLYVLATKETVEIVNQSGWSCEWFISSVDRMVWLELPFAYLPFWERKAAL